MAVHPRWPANQSFHADDPRAHGAFSRRYKTSKGLDAYREAKQSREAAQEAAKIAREEARVNRSNAEQLALLDSRLGEGLGARKERRRLNG